MLRKIRFPRLITLVLCLFVLCSFTGLAASGAQAESAPDETGTMLILTYQEWPEEVPLPILSRGVMTLSTITDDGYELSEPELVKITLSYEVGNNWVEITEENSSSLPANAKYRFEFFYQNLPVNDIIKSNGIITYKGLPDWFIPSGNGALLHENEPVARIEKVGDEIVITFDEAWLQTHSNNTLGGSFRVEGALDWHELPSDSDPELPPGLNVVPSFEGDLPQKYGAVTIEKAVGELIAGEDGKYYLQYTLTVMSRDNVSIPDISVRDLFDTLDYVAGYVAVNDTPGELPGSESALSPWEQREPGKTAGKLSMSGSELLWEIGEMAPGEERVLTYFVEIAASYVDNLINNPINNHAEVFSGPYFKADSRAYFMPKSDIAMSKNVASMNVDGTGNGTITYEVTVTAGEENSFVLENLTIQDAFPADFAQFISGDENGKIIVTVDGKPHEVAFENAGFSFTGVTVEPGQTVVVTYTVYTKDLFSAANGDINLLNTAVISKGSRTMRSAAHTETIRKESWVNKMVGEQIEDECTITITGDVYDYSSGNLTPGENPGTFTVPAGSVYYQIDLNKQGNWDVSGVTVTDKLGSKYLRYAGYVQIEQIDPDTKQVTTFWVKVDDLASFSFSPSDLGIESGYYAYRLSYYAKLVGMQGIGAASVDNSIKVIGKLGSGNGDPIDIDTSMSVDKVVRGSYKYAAEKSSWYYEKQVTPSVGVGSEGYPESAFKGDYSHGAIYWVIRLEGYIPAGSFEGTKNDTKLSGFQVQDSPETSTQEFVRDSVLCAFIGKKDFDIAKTYSDFESLMSSDIQMLSGTPLNHKWFFDNNTALSYDYYWFASNTNLDGIVFNEAHDLSDDEAIFIVLRTKLLEDPPANSSAVYENSLLIDSGAGSVPANTASYLYVPDNSLFKESKGAHVYEPGKAFNNVSDVTKLGDWNPETLISKDDLPSAGIYAFWLLNINYNGKMSGDAYVMDQLPEGMEFVYCQINNFGVGTTDNYPETVYIQELSENPDWQEHEKSGKPTWPRAAMQTDFNIITYYNPSKNQLFWHVTNLNQATNQNQGNDHPMAINLRIICKVTDPELFLNQSKQFTNVATIVDPATGNPVETATSNVTVFYPLDKQSDLSTVSSLKFNRLPFTIKINPFGEDLAKGSDTLPTLIDEFSETLQVVESTIQVLADGQPYSDFTYTVQERPEGGQNLLISGLPDGVPIVITYVARINAAPNTPVSIQNTAYWAGCDRPSNPQVSFPSASFLPGGELFVTNKIAININKVDASSHSKKLDGATFHLYALADDSDPDSLLTPPLFTGTTNSNGDVVFKDDANTPSPRLRFNTVYCIEEKNAPLGYHLPDDEKERRHYFIIIHPDSNVDVDALKAAYADYDFIVWYDSPEYSVTIPNDKGSIGVKKVFRAGNGEEYTPTSGTYRFGLFDVAGNCLQTITIQYENREERYFLNGIPTSSPEFTGYEPDVIYHIFELDESGARIGPGEQVELNGSHYFVSYSHSDVTAQSGEVTVTNQLVPAATDQSLTITKTLHGANVNQSNQEFIFMVNLPEGNRYYYEGSAIEGVEPPASGTIANGETIRLKHGQSITITGLPEDAEYSVMELTAEGYQTSSENPQSGALGAGENHEMEIVNWELVELTLGKTVGGPLGETDREWEFTIVLTIPEGGPVPVGGTYTVRGGSTVDGVEAPTIASIGEHGGTVMLRHGQTITIEGLPFGTTYTVTEIRANADGYATSAEVNGADEELASLSATPHEMTSGETVSFHNHKPAAGMTISKTVTSLLAADRSQPFLFHIVLTPPVGSTFPDRLAYTGQGIADGMLPLTSDGSGAYAASIELTDGQSIIFGKLPVGTVVRVTEAEATNFTTTVTVSGGSSIGPDSQSYRIDAEDDLLQFAFINERKLGGLIITKAVSDPTDETVFGFTIQLDDDSISGAFGDVTFVEGKGSFTLGHGGRVTISGLPAALRYVITETEKEGYQVNAPLNASGTIQDGQIITVPFVNSKETVPPPADTGSLEVSKIVTGYNVDAEQTFSFTITLDDDTVEGVYGDMTFAVGRASFTLRHGATLKATGLPAGIGYHVQESDCEGYTLIYASGDNGVIPADDTARVSFTNTRTDSPTPEITPTPAFTGDLTVSKTVKGQAGDMARAFDFTVMLSDTSVNGLYGDLFFENGVAFFTLRHSEKKTAVGLPAEVSYSVMEFSANQDGYATSSVGDRGVIKAGTTSNAIFVNAKDEADVPQTGDNNHPVRWLALMLFSLLGMGACLNGRRKMLSGSMPKRPE